jgi:hypothetical protein
MDTFKQGDMVVLKSGSMKMLVESVDGENIAVIWAHEGEIGRDSVPNFVLKKWEDRGPDSRGPRRDDERGGRSHGGDRDGGKPYRGRDDRDDKPRGKPGWDGKPREKKYFRKDD